MNQDLTITQLEADLGSPVDLWTRLQSRIQEENLLQFAAVEQDFLDLLWCIDQYRVAGAQPRGLGRDADGAYRMKGGWFSEVVSLLLINQTNSPLAARSKVQGFSQEHQIDVAWPERAEPIRDPLVCVETKVMGAPAAGTKRARPATADWSNRRKELKFQATDLKLFRRQHQTQIDHWDNWRRVAPPSVYFLWCARMDKPRDDLSRMIAELRILNETYLDGSALFAYEANRRQTAYHAIRLGPRDRSVDMDDALHRIANQINDLVRAEGNAPTAHVPLNPKIRASVPDDGLVEQTTITKQD